MFITVRWAERGREKGNQILPFSKRNKKRPKMMVSHAVIPILNHCLGLQLLVLLFSLAPSAVAIGVSNLTVSGVGAYNVNLTWAVVDSQSENATDNLRLYVQVKYSLDFVIDESCLLVDTTTASFSVQPYTAYTACINIVRLPATAGATCNDDTPLVSSKQVCTSLITDFVPWSYFNLTALGCAAAIVVVLLVALAISFGLPREDINDTLDKKKMREWSKKKRSESLRDFMNSLASRQDVNA